MPYQDQRVGSTVNRSQSNQRPQSLELSLEGAQAGMAFVFRGYEYGQSQEGLIKRNSSISNINATMLLPLANNLTDSYSINVGQNEIGGLGALGVAAAGGGGGDLIRAGLDASAKLGSAAANALTGDSASIQSGLDVLSSARGYAGFVGQNLLSSIPGGADINAGLGVGSGTAINPHAALVFNGVGLKTHTFEWKLSPKNKNEATIIRNMANRIRKASLPEYTGDSSTAIGKALMKYPDLVDIWFVGVDSSYFYYFKPCLIQSFSVNYAPDGPVLNRGGIPNSVTFTMQVTEASIHTKEDY